MPFLTPHEIYEHFLNEKIDKITTFKFLTTYIEKGESETLRIEAIKLLGNIEYTSTILFEYLEDLLISDENYLIKYYATELLINLFPEKVYNPLKYALQQLNWSLTDNLKISVLKQIIKELRKSSNYKLKKLLLLREHVLCNDEVYLSQNGTLTLNYLGIKDLNEIKGLEKLNKLIELNLAGNNISDVTPLKNLTNLKTLNLSENKITEIQDLQSLKNLQRLYLSNNKITAMNFINPVYNLRLLNLNHNLIYEINGLQNKANLFTLYLNNNYISELKNLETLHNLYHLSLNNNQICEIRGLEKLHNLRILQLAHNQICEIKNLAHLTKLTNLNLNHNKISRPILLDLPNLYFFSLDHNYIPPQQLSLFYKKYRKIQFFQYL